MTLRTRTGALALASTLAICSVAAASAGKRTFQQTYPLASKLCANVAKGDGPKRLRKFTAQVLVDCTELQSSFKAAQTAVLTTDATLAKARAAQRATVLTSCAGALDHKPSCGHARHNARKAIEGLEKQRIQAAHLYYKAVETARRAFWAKIHALPGGAAIHPDKPIPIESA